MSKYYPSVGSKYRLKHELVLEATLDRANPIGDATIGRSPNVRALFFEQVTMELFLFRDRVKGHFSINGLTITESKKKEIEDLENEVIVAKLKNDDTAYVTCFPSKRNYELKYYYYDGVKTFLRNDCLYCIGSGETTHSFLYVTEDGERIMMASPRFCMDNSELIYSDCHKNGNSMEHSIKSAILLSA